jgi:hypothetical protein
MCDYCVGLGIPLRLCRSDREVVEVQTTDKLYRRFAKDLYQVSSVNNELSASAFQLKNDSYNLKSLCELPSDVLYNIESSEHYFDQGVVEIDLTKLDGAEVVFESDKRKKKGRFKVVHIPEDCMYPHTEIHVYIDDVLTNPVTTKTARALLKDELKKAARVVVIPPTPSE